MMMMMMMMYLCKIRRVDFILLLVKADARVFGALGETSALRPPPPNEFLKMNIVHYYE
jgi:hypothetical protein